MKTANKSENESTNYRKLSSSHTEEKILNYEQEKLMDLKDVDISELNDETSFITNDKINKDKIYYNRQVYHKFCLSVKEVKFNNIKIGYIFKFEPYSNNLEETIITNINKNQRYSKYNLSSLSKQEYNNDIEKSEISYISFAGIKQPLEQRHSFQYNYFENPFDLTCDNNDCFFINLNNETENEFTIDINNMSFKQIRKNDKSERTKLYDLLKKQAIEKISKAAGQIKNEELSEEDEDSSSGTYNESENDNSNNIIKLIMVGDSGTGKTNLISVAAGLEFNTSSLTTTSCSYVQKVIKKDDKEYRVNLWDTIGQEKYRSLTKIFVKDSKIVFLYMISLKEKLSIR